MRFQETEFLVKNPLDNVKGKSYTNRVCRMVWFEDYVLCSTKASEKTADFQG